MERGVPVMPLAVELLGAATAPEVEGARVVASIEQVEAQRGRIDKLMPRLEQLWRNVQRDGLAGAKGGKGVLRRVDAHAPLRDALGGASLRRTLGSSLGGPLGGGRDLGPDFRILGRLMAGDVIVALARAEVSKGANGVVRMLRLGALVADSARTLDELSSGLRVAQEALGVMQRLPDSAFDGLIRGTAKDIRDAHKRLGAYASELRRARQALAQGTSLETLASLASESSSVLWRHESFKVLRGAAWSGVGTERGQRAERLIGAIAEGDSTAQDIRRAAQKTLTKLRASR